MPSSFNALSTFEAAGQALQYYKLDALRASGLDASRLPFSGTKMG
jgi:hypothetical protein